MRRCDQLTAPNVKTPEAAPHVKYSARGFRDDNCVRATACGRLVSARCRGALQAPEMLYLQKLFELTIGPAVEVPEFRVHLKLRTTLPEGRAPSCPPRTALLTCISEISPALPNLGLCLDVRRARLYRPILQSEVSRPVLRARASKVLIKLSINNALYCLTVCASYLRFRDMLWCVPPRQ